MNDDTLAPVVAMRPDAQLPQDDRSDARWRSMAAALLGVGIAISPSFGALYEVEEWGAAGIVIAAVLMAVVVAGPRPLPVPTLIPAIGLAALAAWQWASQSWAESAHEAIVAANRSAVYAGLIALFVVLLRSRTTRSAVITGLLVGATAALAVEAGRLASATVPADFVGGRLNDPLGYYNAQAAALLLAFWPSIALAESSRQWAVRGAAVAIATFSLSISLLAQSRGAVLAVAVSALVILAVVPGRRVRVFALAVAGTATAVAAPVVLDVYTSVPEGSGLPTAEAVHAAVRTSALAALGAGGLWALAAAALGRSPNLSARLSSRAANVVLAGVAVLALLAVGLGVGPRAARSIDRQWTEFVNLGGVDSESRLTSGGGNRYDYWRVAWGQFKDDPVTGLGAGNYTRTYFLERRTSEDVRQPHSLWLQALAETGLVGLALLVVTFLAILAGLKRSARRSRDLPHIRAHTVAAGGIVILWLAQTSVDWLHLLPGLTAAALACAAVLIGDAGWPIRARVGRDLHLRPLVFAATALAVASVGVLTVATVRTNSARDELASNPRSAALQARDALKLNDQNVEAYYVLAAAQARNNQYADARETLRRAEALEPHNFVTPALAGDLAIRRGDYAAAAKAYRRALRLNPRATGLATAALQAEERAR